MSESDEQTAIEQFTDCSYECQFPDYDTLIEFDGGQVAFGDSFIHVIPLTRSWVSAYQDSPLSEILHIVDDRTDCIEDRLGEPLVTERNDTLRLSNQVEGIVYTIDCMKPDSDEKLKQRARRVLSQREIPSWVWAAYHSVNREYIGGTHRPDERMHEHMGLSGDFDGANFTEIFRPSKIQSLILCLSDNVYEIEEREAEYWQDKSDFNGCEFIYQA